MSVSIIIPAHNEAHFITFTVNRLHEVLKDHVPYEVIIIENASTDGTRDALRAIGDVTVIHIDQKVTVSMAQYWHRRGSAAHHRLGRRRCVINGSVGSRTGSANRSTAARSITNYRLPLRAFRKP